LWTAGRAEPQLRDAAPVRLPDLERGGLPVVPRSELLATGLSYQRLRTAVATGRWQEALPGVLVGHSGHLTRAERWAAALCYSGELAVLSHRSALLAHGARIEEAVSTRRAAGVRGAYEPPAEGGLVEVTVPHGHHLRSTGFVVVHQSRRPVDAVAGAGGLRLCSPARCAVDAAITAPRRRDVDHVIAEVLQRGLTTVPRLEEEAAALGRRLTTWLSGSLADARRGMRSVGEADLRRALTLAGVPEPEWGAAIETAEGTYFVDAYWRRRRVAVEADGAEFHLSADDWRRDLRRQNAIQRTDVVLFRYPVRRLRDDPLGCGAEIYRLVA
jgi:hypothetical protein